MKELPNEIIWVILQYLPLKDIYNSILVNKRFYNITQNDNFWKECFEACYYLDGEFEKIEISFKNNLPSYPLEIEITRSYNECCGEQIKLRHRLKTELDNQPNWKNKLEKYKIIKGEFSEIRKKRKRVKKKRLLIDCIIFFISSILFLIYSIFFFLLFFVYYKEYCKLTSEVFDATSIIYQFNPLTALTHCLKNIFDNYDHLQ